METKIPFIRRTSWNERGFCVVLSKCSEFERFHRKLVFSCILELFPESLACFGAVLSLMLSWLPFTADSSLAFIGGEEAINSLKTEEYCGPICIRYCKANSCRLLAGLVADPRAFSSRRKEMSIGKKQATRCASVKDQVPKHQLMPGSFQLAAY